MIDPNALHLGYARWLRVCALILHAWAGWGWDDGWPYGAPFRLYPPGTVVMTLELTDIDPELIAMLTGEGVPA